MPWQPHKGRWDCSTFLRYWGFLKFPCWARRSSFCWRTRLSRLHQCLLECKLWVSGVVRDWACRRFHDSTDTRRILSFFTPCPFWWPPRMFDFQSLQFGCPKQDLQQSSKLLLSWRSQSLLCEPGVKAFFWWESDDFTFDYARSRCSCPRRVILLRFLIQ